MVYLQKKYEIYYDNLKEINGIRFTYREIDIIACILHERVEKKIAAILSISPKTVGTHVYNLISKLNGSKKDIIIEFIKKSGKLELIKQYYICLSLEASFKQQLIKISRLYNKKEIVYTIPGLLENMTQEQKDLVEYLKLANIFLQEENTIQEESNFQDIHILLEKKYKIQDHNYYLEILKFISKIINRVELDQIIETFLKEIQEIKKSWQNNSTPEYPKKTYTPEQRHELINFLALFFFVILFFGLFLWFNRNTNRNHIIVADLIIPTPEKLLIRSEIIKKMYVHLNNNNRIKTIKLNVLMGIGGSGKTTIARYYGKYISNASIVWELNASNKETIMNSFRNLAYHIASDNNLRKQLDYIEKNIDHDLQQKLLLNFIRTQLRSNSNWLLIYDNLESLSQINYMLPQSSDQWGSGNIIITTHNEHITKTSFINNDDIIHVEELTHLEKLSLFVKILYDKKPEELEKQVLAQVIDFLKNIPSFPLEVSIAAYFIKNTHVTFTKYLKNIREYDVSYYNVQSKFLHEATSYNKTRYDIVSAFIQQLIESNTDFKELIFFICLLDCENIPYRLLSKYKNTKTTGDFIYYLRKSGILIPEIYNASRENTKLISIHNSTKNIAKAFLMNALSSKEKECFIKNTMSVIKGFYNDIMQKDELQTITLLVPHLHALLNTLENTNISPVTKNIYKSELELLIKNINY